MYEDGQINSEDICGFCGKPGADKIPHPVRWPGEESAGTPYVHASCEDAECKRAHSNLSDRQREKAFQEKLTELISKQNQDRLTRKMSAR
jgi:hypothetical protein